MYMQHLQPQSQNYVSEESKRIIDKIQTLRSSNQHFKSSSDVKYQNSNYTDNQTIQSKPIINEFQGQQASTLQAAMKKQAQGIQQKANTNSNNQLYQITGTQTAQKNYLQVGKIDLDAILSANKKQSQLAQTQNQYQPQGIVTQREVNKRQTLPPDRRSFQDQFNTTPQQCTNNSNIAYNQPQQHTLKQAATQVSNINATQSQSSISKVGSNGLINQSQNAIYQQQPSINIIQTSNFQNNSSQQLDDLDKYKKQMQQKIVSTTPSKQLLHSYQNQSHMNINTPKGNNRSQNSSEANILYFKGNISSHDLASNQQSRIQSDSQLNLHPSPMKQQNSQQNKFVNNDSSQQITQNQNQAFKNLIQNPDQQNFMNISSFKYQKPPVSSDSITNNEVKKQQQQQQQQQQLQQSQQQQNNQQFSGQNLLNVKNIQFQYIDQSLNVSKNNSNTGSIHQNIPNSPQSAGIHGISKVPQTSATQTQQYFSQTNSQNPSIQNSMTFNQSSSNNYPNEKTHSTNINTINSKTQSIDDILKHLKSKEISKVQTIPQRIFNQTAQGIPSRSYQLNQIPNYNSNTVTGHKDQQVENKNELPLNNPTQIASLNQIAQNEKKTEAKPVVMRQNSDKLQNALTNRADLFQVTPQMNNLQNQQNLNTSCFNNIVNNSNTIYNDYFFNKMNRNTNETQKATISNTTNVSDIGQHKNNQTNGIQYTQQNTNQITKETPTLTSNKLSNSIDQNNYSIQSQKYMYGSSNINNRILPNANFTVSHTYDKNINSLVNQSINNTSLITSTNNNLINSIPQNQAVNLSYFSTLNNSINFNNNIQNQNPSSFQFNNLSHANLDSSISPIKKVQANFNDQEKKQADSFPIQQQSIDNSQNQFQSNISSYYNSPNLQYAHPTVRQNDLSSNSILSSINYAVTTASGLTTNRTNNNLPSASISVTSTVKPINQSQTQAINEGDQQKQQTKDNQLQQSNLSTKRNSEISYQKALDEIKPSEQVEKILDEIRRKNSSGISIDKQQQQQTQSQQQLQTRSSYEESQLKNSPQINGATQAQQTKQPNSNLLQSIQNLNLDVKGILQNTISKNISTVSSQYQQLLYRGNAGTNNEFTTNNNNSNSNISSQQNQQSVVDKILQEIKRNDMKKHLQSVLTVNSQVNTSNNITNNNINNANSNANGTLNYNDFSLNTQSSSISPYILNKTDTSNIYNLTSQKNDQDNIFRSQNILEYSSNIQINSQNLVSSSAVAQMPVKSDQKLQLAEIQKDNTQNNTNESRKALENELDELKAKYGERKHRLSSFSNKKDRHHLDIPNNVEDSDDEGKDSIGSHESFIEERESIQKFSTNCSQLTTEPLRQTKMLILNSIISKDSFKKDDLSASKQPVFSSLSFSQNQADMQNHTPANKTNEHQIIQLQAATQDQNNQAINEFNSSSKPSSKVPTLISFSPSLNQIPSKNDIITEEQSKQNEVNSKVQSETQINQVQNNIQPNTQYGEKDFYFVKKLGKGKHSEVFLAQDKKTGFLFAVKQIHKEDMISMGMEEQFSNEIKIQMSLNHPNIIRLYGFYQDEYYFYLLMEYAPGGEIYRYQKTLPDGRFTETEAAFYLYQLANALRYLHSRNVIHRDIKPENLLISNGVVKLADFGYSRVCDFKSTRSTFCGTLDYLSPQVVKGQEYNHDVDVWAFGVMCYEFLQGIAPFYEKSKDDTLDKIQSGKYSFIKPISEEAKTLIQVLLDSESKNRVSINDVCRCSWLIQNAETYKQEQGPISQQELNNIFK
ncbi:kinase domain protein (macronuclear) [Tetrahymena thermophila SB210]|uniref:Aurora kinase n=1 Tax=Tetrahymena thermophila (strain SB210) TaxID=312017 RepID=I7LTH5_TETTS|nr:kinase domain protein [Tetrahymena thermophila SB210]EAR85254.2 kinase domain protein [Tetrahymena thermophila SB210]|eukprot:XP_001032917.2 kinase domain protein [Tetrahymena thermophila SB210]